MGRELLHTLPILLFLNMNADGGMKMKHKKNKTYTLTLCAKCRAEFESSGNNNIRRANPRQEFKEKCTYCNVRDGYDYVVTPKSRKEVRRWR